MCHEASRETVRGRSFRCWGNREIHLDVLISFQGLVLGIKEMRILDDLLYVKTFRVAFCMIAFVSFHEDIAGVFESMKKTGKGI